MTIKDIWTAPIINWKISMEIQCQNMKKEVIEQCKDYGAH